MTLYDYRIATGHSVALGGLTNVETLIGAPPRGDTLDPFPVRTTLMDGTVRGDGHLNVTWNFNDRVAMSVLTTIENQIHTNGTVVSVAVTIYTRRHNRGTYARYNAYSILPQPGVDYVVRYGFADNLRWRFTNLVAL